MHRPVSFFPLLALVFADTCRVATAPGLPPAGEPVTFQRVGSWLNTGLDEPARLVIRDGDAWRGFWARLEERRSPKTEPPAVNFGDEVVVAVAMGARSSGGYAIRIERVLAWGERLYVDVNEISPGRRCLVTAALTQPVDAIRLAAPGAAVEFVTRHTTRHCD